MTLSIFYGGGAVVGAAGISALEGVVEQTHFGNHTNFVA